MDPYADPRQADFRRRNWLARKIKRAPGRITRLHTERGQLPPLNEFLRLPANLVSHLRRQDSTGSGGSPPWMSRPAVEWLDSAIRPDWSILELGSGASSVWFASRARRLLSLEHDPDWFRSSQRVIAGAGLGNAELVLCPHEEFAGRLARMEPGSFDLVVVDHLDGEQLDRTRSVELVRNLVKPEGYLLLDDSDRVRYRSVDSMLAGWGRQRFVGLKAYPPAFAVESTAYRRPP